MKAFNTVINTDGGSLWSNSRLDVRCTSIDVPYINEENNFGELKVYFNTDSWDVDKHGLIYTDYTFLEVLKEQLIKMGLAGNDMDYSEQGMQGDDYVSFDVYADFVASWDALAFCEKYADVMLPVMKRLNDK